MSEICLGNAEDGWWVRAGFLEEVASGLSVPEQVGLTQDVGVGTKKVQLHRGQHLQRHPHAVGRGSRDVRVYRGRGRGLAAVPRKTLWVSVGGLDYVVGNGSLGRREQPGQL